MWNLKYGTNESNYKIVIVSGTQRTDLWLLRGMGEGDRGMDWEFWFCRYKVLHL